LVEISFHFSRKCIALNFVSYIKLWLNNLLHHILRYCSLIHCILRYCDQFIILRNNSWTIMYMYFFRINWNIFHNSSLSACSITFYNSFVMRGVNLFHIIIRKCVSNSIDKDDLLCTCINNVCKIILFFLLSAVIE